ncbi:MAG: hypothetical protein WCO44_03560 [Bacteroidota bacterium]
MSRIEIKKYGLVLRTVEESDAEFIVTLRTNKRNSGLISDTSTDIDKQREWIRAYIDREVQGTEFYFITEDGAGNPLGTMRIYNLTEDSFEGGSWVFLPGTNIEISILTTIIVREYGFYTLNKEYDKFEVRKNNSSVVKFQKLCGSKIIRENEFNFYYVLDKTVFEQTKIKLLNLIYHGSE